MLDKINSVYEINATPYKTMLWTDWHTKVSKQYKIFQKDVSTCLHLLNNSKGSHSQNIFNAVIR